MMNSIRSLQALVRSAPPRHHHRRYNNMSSSSSSMQSLSSSCHATQLFRHYSHQPNTPSPLRTMKYGSRRRISTNAFGRGSILLFDKVVIASTNNGWPDRRNKCYSRNFSTLGSKLNEIKSGMNGGDATYAVASITHNTNNTPATNTNTLNLHPSSTSVIATSNTNIQLTTKELSIQEIIKEMPGTHGRDFFSLSLTSLDDASRKRRASMMNHYTVKNSIHPWFILPREEEIVMAFGCLRAIINRKSALIFNAHTPAIRQQAKRISERIMRKDPFAFRDGEIIFHNPNASTANSNFNSSTSNTQQFEIDMVEHIIREVTTMYSRRLRLYEPIVNSLMDRVTNEAFSPSGLHKLVPVKDSLQHFEMNVKGALGCITDLLSNDEDMLDLLLTEKALAKQNGETLPLESHEHAEILLEEYARRLNSILLEIDYLLQRVQSKQDMVALSLDAYRNRMIRTNLYLTVGGISLAFGTAVAGFFGMNVVNGLEEAEGVFEAVVVGSSVFGVGFLVACYSYVNGSIARKRTFEHLGQIEVMNRALGDMSALDYSLELMLNETEPLTKEKFREKIYASEPECIRDTEVDFLFDLLDYSGNHLIDQDDFQL